MAYTLGALHDLLAGSGSISLSSPAGLLLTVLGYPIVVGVQPGTPTTLHRLGHITPGDPNGWHPKVQIIQTTQLVLPVPAGLTLCGYDLVYGAGLSIRELIGGPVPNSEKQPWDRGMTAWGMHANANVTPGAGNTVMWAYTVPSGKNLYISHLGVRTRRGTVATAWGVTRAQVVLNGVIAAYAADPANVIGSVAAAALDGGAQVVGPGSTISAEMISTDTGGAVSAYATGVGFLFDA